jgi:cephalosporin-C deacetylase-like acetyl esterase
MRTFNLACCLLALVPILAAQAPAAEKAAPKAKSPATATATAPAQELAVLGPDAGGPMLRDYLLKECGKCFDARRKAIEAITTPEQVLARQKALREAWAAAIGPFPERTPLNARITGTLDRPAYRIEKVLYESRPGHHVTANLYVPKAGKPPYPGVLVPCGHSANGKAMDSYQSISILLASHGFVALIYDPIGQGERIQTFGPDGKPAASGTGEHTLIDIGARLVGRSTAQYRIWDGIRSIDYLCSRPEVDSNRIGCTGNSGGGTLTSYLMATDERISPAAPSCYITTLERLFATLGPQDGEQNIPGQVALGIDHADYILMRAPEPTIILAATKDFFDISGTWDTMREAKRLYTLLGHGERVDICEAPGPHGYARFQREAALRWMQRWLQDTDDAATEAPPQLAKDAELQVTQTGHAVPELKGRTAWDFNLDEAKRLCPERAAFWRDNPKEKCLAEVRRMAAVRPLATKPTAKAAGTVRRDGCTIEKLIIERPDEVPVPALLFLPEPRAGKAPAVLYVSGRGKAADAAPGGAIETLVKSGRAVLAIDVRGIGETAAVAPKAYWSKEYPIAFLALHLARPLLGQRVEDTLAALDVLAARPEIDAGKIEIVGVEAGGPIALHAAALDGRLREATLVRSIESWMDVVATPLSKNQLAQVVPAALTRYDLPDLVRAIALRPVHVIDPVDPKGEPKQK